MPPKLRAVVAALVAAVALAACGSTKADEIGLHYNGGPIEGESFEGIVDPGSGQQFIGPGDRIVTLPLTTRTYEACADVRDGDDGCDGPPIVVPAGGGGELAISIAVSFKVNTSADVLRAFYENVCRKFGCEDDGNGWDEMLRVNFRGPIENALRDSVIEFSVDELYAGLADGENASATSTLSALEDALAAGLKENINAFAGGQFFCGPSFNRAEPDVCPDFEFLITDVVPADDGLRGAYNEAAAAEQRITTAERNAEAEVAAARGEEEAARILSALAMIPGYIDLLRAQAMEACASNPECTLVVTDAGTDVNVNAGSSGGAR